MTGPGESSRTVFDWRPFSISQSLYNEGDSVPANLELQVISAKYSGDLINLSHLVISLEYTVIEKWG